ncbi:MATE efflux family protein ALF5 [Apostasia shenzhenica]|uniref:MATE efflux family protein ALF5 n=1 Tax=Apostasia shenzhenica TaxID=1088818 RepID=A0A2I0AC20_9ASPA|nr:MATE efflux family protein ALF5 [Apostasia shenzhenica]
MNRWCYEILILLAGLLPDARRAVAVLTIVLNFDYLLYGLMISIATCASTRVANELGAGDSRASRAAAGVAFLLSAVAGLASGGAIVGLKGIWGRLFSADEGVVSSVRAMLPLMAAADVFSFPLARAAG